jgi:asparagine synthase (glutamine-hydrolysing)
VSKFCGIYHFDARPASPEDEDRVRTALDSPGCFTPLTCRQPGLVMGWAAGFQAPSSQGLLQLPDRSVCLWDGRIDNRGDLLGQEQSAPPQDRSDAAIVLNLYRQKGVDGLRDVVGDWSCCIWDANRREIVLASDYAGIRPLYYHCRAGSLYWSSSLADLVRWTGIAEIDETYVASFLLRNGTGWRTPYAGISPVPSGHAISIAPGRIAGRAFWTLPIHQEIRYRDERQYEERMLELFREGVQARLATGAPTCSELSGGLDSSSIVCMADRLLKESSSGSELITFSYTHENSLDEKFFLAVERACKVSAHHLPLQEYPAADARRMGVVPAIWEPRFQGLASRMAELGSGVLLTGQLGDFVMGNTSDDSGQVTEWLAKGGFGRAVRESYAWGRAMQAPIYPILWRGIREAYFSWVPSVDPRDSVGAMPASREDSLTAGLHARFESEERERLAGDPARHAPSGCRRRFRTAAQVLQSRVLQTPEALQPVSCTHPYAHRPLLEFMLTIPPHIVVAPGQPRRLMRRAFAGLLPPAILGRRSKGVYVSTYRQSLVPLAAALLKGPGVIQVVERGYVEPKSLTGRLEKFVEGLDCNETHLLPILLLEFWLRHRAAAKPLPESSVHTSRQAFS